jgi:hypothetical protein
MSPGREASSRRKVSRGDTLRDRGHQVDDPGTELRMCQVRIPRVVVSTVVNELLQLDHAAVQLGQIDPPMASGEVRPSCGAADAGTD